ncbi:MAG: multidrug resistance efflux pump [Glaciecola sp.]|jgi:multidrug resistance efflux pump
MMNFDRFFLCALAWIFLLAICSWIIIEPGWQKPQNSTYTSRLGRAALIRLGGQGFQVTLEQVSQRRLSRTFHGEGLVESDSVLVPAIPVASVLSVEVTVGQTVKVGQVLATLDRSLHEIKLLATKAGIAIAQAELERTRIGSAYTLAQERPIRDAISLIASQERYALAKENLDMYEGLNGDGFVSREALLAKRESVINSMAELRVAEWAMSTSEAGRTHSIEIGNQAVEEALLAHAHRVEEKENYTIRSPVDGVVERVLLRAGEYSQDPGRPAFVISSGLWFSAHLDQGAIGRVSKASAVEVRLEAFPGVALPGKVRKIVPFVTFNLGGPEINRPIRPQGSGAPEWPATFRVEVEFAPQTATPDYAQRVPRLVPGLTGFARVKVAAKCIAVSKSSLLSLSSSKALLYVVGPDGSWSPRAVTVGIIDDAWVEIVHGVAVGERVLSTGHEILEPDDAIQIVDRDWQE